MVALLSSTLAADRCRSVFDTALGETVALRNSAADECRTLLEQAARAAVRAGRLEVANDALSLLQRADSGANHQVVLVDPASKPRIGFLP